MTTSTKEQEKEVVFVSEADFVSEEDYVEPELPVGKTSTVEDMLLGDITIDTAVQRQNINTTRVEGIAKAFNFEAFGLPSISKRKDGTSVAIDGMHRLEALRRYLERKGIAVEDFIVQCEVWTDLDARAEARVFLLRNNTAQVTAIDRFLVRLTAEDPIALGMNAILQDNGWKASSAKSDQAMAAIKTLEYWFVRDPYAARLAVEVATAAWGHTIDTLDRRVYGGLAMFLSHYSQKINVAELVDRLMKELKPGSLIGASLTRRNIMKGKVDRACLEELLALYNKNRTKTKLPPYSGN